MRDVINEFHRSLLALKKDLCKTHRFRFLLLRTIGDCLFGKKNLLNVARSILIFEFPLFLLQTLCGFQTRSLSNCVGPKCVDADG